MQEPTILEAIQSLDLSLQLRPVNPEMLESCLRGQEKMAALRLELIMLRSCMMEPKIQPLTEATGIFPDSP